MSSLSELSHQEIKRFSPGLQKVIEDLTTRMPDDAWRIETYQNRHKTFAKELQTSLRELFLPGNPMGRGLEIIMPKTLAIGLFSQYDKVTSEGHPPFNRDLYPIPIRCGLFSMDENERYGEDEIMRSLRGNPSNVVSHEMVDLPKITGRKKGVVSPILEESYLRNLSVINFSPFLIDELSGPDAVAVYSLGYSLEEAYHFCARGADFLNSYRTLINNLGIRNNLGNAIGKVNC